MGTSRTGHGERHSGTMPGCAAGKRSGSVCQLRAVYASHRARAGKFSGTGAEDPRGYACSSYHGNGAQALRDLAVVMRDVLGPKAEDGETTPAGMIKP